jgi:hypothetical protein
MGRDSAAETTLISDVCLAVGKSPHRPTAAGRRRWQWFVGFGAVVLLGVLSSVWLLSKRLDDSRVEPGTRWEGHFTFADSPPDAGGDVWLRVTDRDGDEITAVYNAESKYEWEVKGVTRKGTLDLKFVSVLSGEETPELLEHGKLTGTVRGAVMDLTFEDAGDGSRATMRLLLDDARR